MNALFDFKVPFLWESKIPRFGDSKIPRFTDFKIEKFRTPQFHVLGNAQGELPKMFDVWESVISIINMFRKLDFGKCETFEIWERVGQSNETYFGGSKTIGVNDRFKKTEHLHDGISIKSLKT